LTTQLTIVLSSAARSELLELQPPPFDWLRTARCATEESSTAGVPVVSNRSRIGGVEQDQEARLQQLCRKDGTISLTTPQPLKPGELVQVSATTGTLSLTDGRRPISPAVWAFRVVAGVAQGILVDSGQLTRIIPTNTRS